MSGNQRPSPQHNSLSSTTEDISEEELHIQSFTKQMLQSRLFIGNFQEKRYVDSLLSYRDVIVVGNQETELMRDLDIVKKRINGYYKGNYWIGITGPDMVGAPVGNCLWVELPDTVFGSYWYKIIKIKFRPNEALLRLKVIRPVSIPPVSSPKLSSSQQSEVQGGANESSIQEKLNESLNEVKNSLNVCLQLLFTNVLTLQNTVEALKFTSVLLVALFTGCVQFFQYLGEFSLKLLRELSSLIKTLTPIIIAFINLIGKIVGGFYLLILSMWRDSKGRPPASAPPLYARGITNQPYPYRAYNTVYFNRGLPMAYPRRNTVTITPLN